MEHILNHTCVGFCWWDLPAALVLVGVIAVFILRHRKMKKQEKELEETLSELYADETVNVGKPV